MQPPGERVPRLVPFDVDDERRVPAPAGFAARPLRGGDDAARLHSGVRETDVFLGAFGGKVSERGAGTLLDRKSTRLNSSHVSISYAVSCLRKKKCWNIPTETQSKSNMICQ